MTHVTVEWPGEPFADGTPVCRLGHAGQWSPYGEAPAGGLAGVHFGIFRKVVAGTAVIELTEGPTVVDDHELLHPCATRVSPG